MKCSLADDVYLANSLCVCVCVFFHSSPLPKQHREIEFEQTFKPENGDEGKQKMFAYAFNL